MKKFLLVSNVARSVVNFRLDLLEHISNLGYQVAVACPVKQDHAPHVAKLRSLGIEVYPLGFSRVGVNPVADWQSYKRCRGVLKEYKPDCVMAYTVKPISYFVPVAKSYGVENCYSMLAGLGYAFSDNHKTIKSKLVSSVVRKLYKNALSKSDGVIFQNHDDPDLLSQLGVFQDSERTHVVAGSGVNLEYFCKRPLPSGDPAFIIAARLLKEKGVFQYLEAAKKLKAEYPESRFLVAGGIDDNPSSLSKSELDEWVASGCIEYLGHVKDIREAVAQASVFVLPSFYREGTPRSILEAMAMGRAVITTDGPGCRETVRHDWNGFLVEPKSTSSLVEAMESLILNSEKISVFGENSYALACDKYDVRKVNHMMCEIMGLS